MQLTHIRWNPIAARRGLRLLALVTLMLATFLLVSSALAWNTSTLLPSSQNDIGYPHVYVDDQGYAHFVWVNLTSDLNDGRASYIRGQLDANGNIIAWDGAADLSGLTGQTIKLNVSIPTVVVDATGVVHVAYGGEDDGNVYYLRNEQRGIGEWSHELAAVPSGGGGGNYFHTIALDDAGTPYIAWGNGLNPSRLVMVYRLAENQWSGIIPLSESLDLVRNPSMVVTGAGDTARIAVLYQARLDKESTDFTIGFASGPRSGPFTDVELSDEFGQHHGTDPWLTVDRDNPSVLYASFVHEVGTHRYSSQFTTSVDGGLSWTAPTSHNVNGNDCNLPELNSMDVSNGIVYMTAEFKLTDCDLEFDYREIYAWSYNPTTQQFGALERISKPDITSTRPIISVGANGKAAVWPELFTVNVVFSTEAGGDTGAAPAPAPVVVTPSPTSAAPPAQATATPTTTPTTNPSTPDANRINLPLIQSNPVIIAPYPAPAADD